MADIYVATTGHDDTGDGSSGNPYLTVSKAISVAAGFDRIAVKAGTYSVTATNSITSVTGLTIQGYQTTLGDLTGVKPVLTTATDNVTQFTLTTSTLIRFVNLKITSTASTKGSGFTTAGGGDCGTVCLESVDLDGLANGLLSTSRSWAALYLSRCTFRNITTDHIIGSTHFNALDCLFVGGRYGIAEDYTGTIAATNCVFAGMTNALYGIASNRGTQVLARNCAFQNTTGSAIELQGSVGSGGYAALDLMANSFYGCGAYGVSLPNYATAADGDKVVYRNYLNAYGNNTSGNLNHLSAGIGDITLTADPLTDYANGNYAPNTTAGGGALLRGAASLGQDIGAVQHRDQVSFLMRGKGA